MVLTKFLRKVISLLKIIEKNMLLPYNKCTKYDVKISEDR